MAEPNDSEKQKAGAKPPKNEEAEAAKLAPAVPLGETRWDLKEQRNPGYWICVPVGTTVEQLFEPQFWANVARHLRPSSTIEVHWDDASQFAELYVLDAGRNWASVDVLRHKKELKRPELKHLADEYDVGFNGPVERFRIVRRSDRAVIKSGFATEGEARQFLAEYKRKMAA
jgi:hypothetical protein